MDWNAILSQLGLSGAVIAALVWEVNRRGKRIDDLTDKLIGQTGEVLKQNAADALILERLTEAVRGGKP